MGEIRDLLKKIRDTRGTFHAKMGTVKETDGKDPTETEEKLTATLLERLLDISIQLRLPS